MGGRTFGVGVGVVVSTALDELEEEGEREEGETRRCFHWDGRSNTRNRAGREENRLHSRPAKSYI